MTLKKIGAVWRVNKDGKRYFSGKMEYINGIECHILLMEYSPRDATKKPTDKDPAYTLLLDVPDVPKPLPLGNQFAKQPQPTKTYED